MSGILYFDDDKKPVVGTKLIVIVDSVNKPTGMWDGELITVGSNDQAVPQHAYYLPDEWWTFCNAHITDPRAPREFIGREPNVNYSAYIATGGSQYLRYRLHDANIEIHGLKRRMEVERGVWHGMIKAIVHPDTFPRLDKLLQEFMAKLGR